MSRRDYFWCHSVRQYKCAREVEVIPSYSRRRWDSIREIVFTNANQAPRLPLRADFLRVLETKTAIEAGKGVIKLFTRRVTVLGWSLQVN